MNQLITHVINQLQYNEGKNIFFADSQLLQFEPNTLKLIKEQKLKSMASHHREQLIDVTIQHVLQQLYKINQYYYFDEKALYRLKLIYQTLMKKLLSLPDNTSEDEIVLIEKKHYSNLRRWLSISNPFAEKVYPADEPMVQKKIVCEEYSPELQLQVLGIKLQEIQEPILDIGCGTKALLVKHLQKQGLEVWGIDRLVANGKKLISTSWFDFSFGEDKWGTIISNLAYSNHFQHHHLRAGGDYQLYAIKYKEILNSLKNGGSFFYAPHLPFIEQHVDTKIYKITTKPVEGTNLMASRIIKF